MNFEHFLSDPWADHPIVNRHICFGGGSSAPEVPDYSQYISAMTAIGNKLTGYGDELFKWAKEAGIKVSDIADTVSGRAGFLADESGRQYTDAMKNWKQYEPLYDAQRQDAQRTMGDLPATQEQYAGKYAADVAQAFDASKQSQDRALRSYGLKAPGSGAAALDGMVSNQRGLAQVAASEQGRMAARNEARSVTSNALASGRDFTGVAQQSAGTSLAAGNQQIGAPESAISTTVGAYSPGLSAYGTAMPYMKAWGDTMSNSYNQRLAQWKADESSGGSGIGSLAGTVIGTGIGAYFGGPMGASAGASIGGSLGGTADRSFAEGGAVPGEEGDNYVDPGMSQSQGAITDDVPARLNVGEFVIPKDVVAWKGEEFFQKMIDSTRNKREQNTVAEPEMAEASAIDARPPSFQSEGASV